MSVELINRISIRKDGVYISTHSNNDTSPYHSVKIDSLSKAYLEGGQAELDKKVIDMCFYNCQLRGNHTSILPYKEAIQKAVNDEKFTKIRTEYRDLDDKAFSIANRFDEYQNLTKEEAAEKYTELKPELEVLRNKRNEYIVNIVTQERETIARKELLDKLDSLKKGTNSDLFNQSFLSKIQALEEDSGEYFLDYYKIQELKVTSSEDLYQYLKDIVKNLMENGYQSEIEKIPGEIKKELKEYYEYFGLIEAGESVFTEEELNNEINIVLKNKDVLTCFYSSEGNGIYFEICDPSGEEIDGGIQLWGLENMQPMILQERLINSLLEMCNREKERLEDWTVLKEIPEMGEER